jgi:hypothetical protein
MTPNGWRLTGWPTFPPTIILSEKQKSEINNLSPRLGQSG